MSSSSSPAWADATEGAGLVKALTEVAENSLFAFCDPCNPEGFTEWLRANEPSDPGSPAGTWLTSIVAFDGVFRGRLEMVVPVDLARELCASFAGKDTDELPDNAVSDFAGEFANMVCGLWLTTFSRQHLFELRPPVVTPSSGGTVLARAEREAGTAGLKFVTVNDTPVCLRLCRGSH